MSRRPLVPEVKEELDRIKIEFANEFGMKFNDGYRVVEAFEKKLVDK